MGLSTIQWTDYTFNPWIGCRKVAPECANCYAETLDRNRYSKTLAPGTKENPVSHWGSGPRHRTKTWGDPVKWNTRNVWCPNCNEWMREKRIHSPAAIEARLPADELTCPVCHSDKVEIRRPRVFCASLADWLDDENVPIEWFADLLKLIHDTPNLDWLLLTKRPHNWRKRIQAALANLVSQQTTPGPMEHKLYCVTRMLSGTLGATGWLERNPPANVWIGVSAGADQAAALDIPAQVHFLSCEPMLGPLKCTDGRCPQCGYTKQDAAEQMDHYLCGGPGPKGFDWIIFGGESGNPKHKIESKRPRPFDLLDLEKGLQFCHNHDIAAFVKQMGSDPRFSHDTYPAGLRVDYGWAPHVTFPEGHKIKLRDKHGGDINEWPEHLRVREFPTVK